MPLQWARFDSISSADMVSNVGIVSMWAKMISFWQYEKLCKIGVRFLLSRCRSLQHRRVRASKWPGVGLVLLLKLLWVVSSARLEALMLGP